VRLLHLVVVIACRARNRHLGADVPPIPPPQHTPAMTMGVAAPLIDMVLNTSSSVRKCASATTNDSSVAPATAGGAQQYGSAPGCGRGPRGRCVPCRAQHAPAFAQLAAAGCCCKPRQQSQQLADTRAAAHTCTLTVDGRVGGVACADEAQPARQQRPGGKQPAIQLIHCK
jgi:hypothetical protein